MKHYTIMLMLFCAMAVTTSCIDDLFNTGNTFVEGELVEASLDLTVNDLVVNADPKTRASIPTGGTETASDAENKISDIWVFQFKEADGSQLINPVYMLITSEDKLKNLPIKLAEDEKSLVYVVANTHNSEWGKGISTLKALKESTIPTPDPILIGTEDGMVGEDDFTIPMEGCSEPLTVTPFTTVKVYVTRMFAKLKIKVDITEDPDKYEMNLNNIEINNIPWYSRIETQSCGNGKQFQEQETKAGEYANVEWITRTFKPSTDPDYTYIIYVPENIQGETVTEEAANRPLDAPPYALQLNMSMAHTEKGVLNNKGDKVEVTDEYRYKVYPGGNLVNNFNIKRNNVYNITVKVKSDKPVQHNPSSNCFIVKPGQWFSFEPYYRMEEGGGYLIKDYLDASDPNSDKYIAKVGIIWQTKSCIGDNTNGDLVFIREAYPQAPDVKNRWKIYLKAANKGNALIGAYNSKGDIIWSWHIWCTGEGHDPANIANAIQYYTYKWDSNGINTKVRVPGYGVMTCNLGALRDGPSDGETKDKKKFENTDTYFGMLYQWGRKDPFPPLIQITPMGDQLYNDDNTGIHYGNDNQTVATKIDDVQTNGEVFYSINATTVKENNIQCVDFSIKHPTVFICSTWSTTQAIRNNNSENWFDKDIRQNNNDPINHSADGDWNLQSTYRLWGAVNPDAMNTTSYTVGDPKYHYNRHYPFPEINRIGKNNVPNYKQDSDAPDEIKAHLIDNYGTKSIFDPCPTGWRVPPNDMWIGFTDTGENPLSLNNFNVKYPNGAITEIDVFDTSANYYTSRCYGLDMYMTEWQQGVTSYFPTQGCRAPCGSGFRTGSCGNYYSANPDKHNRINTLHIHDNIIDTEAWYDGSDGVHNGTIPTWTNYFQVFETLNYMYHIKGAACPIRCVRDTK